MLLRQFIDAPPEMCDAIRAEREEVRGDWGANNGADCQGWELSYVREARSLFELTKRHPEVASVLLLQNR